MIRVLIADDHPFLRGGLEAVLRAAGCEVVAAVGDGAEALAAIRREQPDAAIVDVAMPKLDGIALLETLRAEGNPVPVVLLTAKLGDVQLVRAIRAGVDAILFKDGAEESLVACLREVVAGGTAIPPELADRAARLDLRPELLADPLAGLSGRERGIVELVGHGLRNRDIATRLGTSEGTVKVYLHEVYHKLGISNRTELALLVQSRS